MTKKRDSDEVLAVMHLMDVIVAAFKIAQEWVLDETLTKFFRFAGTNAQHMLRDYVDIKNMPEGKEKEKAWRHDPWSKIDRGIMFSLENLTKSTAIMVWLALVVGRHVNRMRQEKKMPIVSFWDLAVNLDKEFGEVLDVTNQADVEDWQPIVRTDAT